MRFVVQQAAVQVQYGCSVAEQPAVIADGVFPQGQQTLAEVLTRLLQLPGTGLQTL